MRWLDLGIGVSVLAAALLMLSGRTRRASLWGPASKVRSCARSREKQFLAARRKACGVEGRRNP